MGRASGGTPGAFRGMKWRESLDKKDLTGSPPTGNFARTRRVTVRNLLRQAGGEARGEGLAHRERLPGRLKCSRSRRRDGVGWWGWQRPPTGAGMRAPRGSARLSGGETASTGETYGDQRWLGL